ncbi:LPXTG cell wall anchor domain-containing protein [Enterococcus faecium]|uniref:LPXTG cell wall anchor domain-containing protein n=1 Tax=Enterococcus faecium TaxID=1352 RepID=UPI001CF1DD32|nr:LPXTG cell wall anchor domain-containing protein [Enterococcus faecium]MCA6741104.1 LPXTG cell wall anchor domain-containing protein [Enterococcus faecium]
MNKTLKLACLTGILFGSLAVRNDIFADSINQDSSKTNVEIQLVKVPLPGKFPETNINKDNSSPKYFASNNKKLSNLPKTGEEVSRLSMIGAISTIATLFIFWLTNKNRKEDQDVHR